MRAIDADALLNEIDRIYKDHYVNSCYQFIHDFFRAMFRRILKAPTIAPASLRPKGEWERRMVQDPRINTDMAWCSNCGYHMIFKREFDNFCPNCGADMRGETHDS